MEYFIVDFLFCLGKLINELLLILCCCSPCWVSWNQITTLGRIPPSHFSRAIPIVAGDYDAAHRPITNIALHPRCFARRLAGSCFRVRSQGKMFDSKNAENPNFCWLSCFLSSTHPFSFFFAGGIPMLFRSMGDSNCEDLVCVFASLIPKIFLVLVDLMRSDAFNHCFISAK